MPHATTTSRVLPDSRKRFWLVVEDRDARGQVLTRQRVRRANGDEIRTAEWVRAVAAH